jgi:hypothetical protein
VPTISKLDAAAPESDSALLPSASSVTAMSATLIRSAVLVLSARIVTTVVRSTAVGASLTSVTPIENDFSVARPPASAERTRIE